MSVSLLPTIRSFARPLALMAAVIGVAVPTLVPDRAVAATNQAPSCTDFGAATDGRGTMPGTATLPYPTLEHLTAVWEISGDNNANGTVRVRVRPAGGQWRAAGSLRRVPGGTNSIVGRSWSNKHAGTLFGLQPGTRYDVELFLSDPDGGCAIRTLSATTRSAPVPKVGGRIVSATPSSFSTVRANALPGDILELKTGTYPAFSLTKNGLAGSPITLRPAAGAAPVIAGDVNLEGRAHVILDRLTIRGTVRIGNTRSIAITRSTVTPRSGGNGHGILGWTRLENAYIADNTVRGLSSWTEASIGVSGTGIGEGIQVNGPGHVIENNRVSGFMDAISLVEASSALEQLSIDILRNDISVATDDAVEADYCFHNCRVSGNRLANVFIGVSSQPSLGGPTYFLRNAIYNAITTPFKLHNGSVGDVIAHNTSVKQGTAFAVTTKEQFARQLIRNNIFIGGPGGSYGDSPWGPWSTGTGAVADLPAAAPSVDMDYDGFGSDFGTFTGTIGASRFASLDEMRRFTNEKHATALGLGVFQAAVPYPTSPFPPLGAPDLRPREDGAAVDAGAHLPGLNDSYAGAAPDLGAYEAGQALPRYGPR